MSDRRPKGYTLDACRSSVRQSGVLSTLDFTRSIEPGPAIRARFRGAAKRKFGASRAEVTRLCLPGAGQNAPEGFIFPRAKVSIVRAVGMLRQRIVGSKRRAED